MAALTSNRIKAVETLSPTQLAQTGSFLYPERLISQPSHDAASRV